MSEIEARSCRGLFKKLDILPVSYQYTLSLMLCVIDNQNSFYTGLKVLRLNTRKNQLYIPTANLYTFQKGVIYSGVRIFNRLPSKTHTHILRVHTQFTHVSACRSVETYALRFPTKTLLALQSRTFHTRHTSHTPSFVHPSNNGVACT